MAAKINEIIGEQPFESIRDRIGLILAEEIANQYLLTGNENLNLTGVWIDRTNPFNFVDAPCINVTMADLQSEQNAKASVSSDETARYNIDVYCSQKSTPNESGSVLSRQQAQKILGIVRVILEDSRYNTLDFPKPSLTGVKANSIQMADANNEDNQNIAMGRLVLEVRGVSGLKLGSTVPLDRNTTEVRLENTTRGLRYIYQK